MGAQTVPLFKEFIAPCDWRTVDFISDLHLHPHEGATFAAWQNYMQTIQKAQAAQAAQATLTDALFILGDLFESWVGDDVLADPSSFEAQCCAVLRATAQRLPVFFMQGNRDFLAGSAFVRYCGITPLTDPAVLVWGGQRILLSHGDALCLGDIDYQNFRVQARSSAWQQPFLAQPLETRRAQARSIRNQSKARKQSGAWYADVDSPAACQWLHAASASTLIHGHTHRPAEHTLANGLVRVVLSDWDCATGPPRAEVLRWSVDGTFVRLAQLRSQFGPHLIPSKLNGLR